MNNKFAAFASAVASGAGALRAVTFTKNAVEAKDTLEKVLWGTAAVTSGISSISFGSAAIELLRAPQIDDTAAQSSVARKKLMLKKKWL